MPDLAPEDNESTSRTDFAAARRHVAERLALPPTAFSTDGATFAFEAPLSFALPAGTFVEIRTADGAVYFGQALEAAVVQRDGPEVSVEGDAGLGLGLVSSNARVANTSFRVKLRHLEGSGVLLGRLTERGTAPTSVQDVFENASIAVASSDTVAGFLEAQRRDRAALEIGQLLGNADTPAVSLQAAGFGRHTFLCGQSGSGKTYALGVILERLLVETDLRIVIIDPNSDYVRLGELRTTPPADGSSDPLAERYSQSASGIRVLRPAKRGSASPDALRLRFSTLSRENQGLLLQMDPLADRDEYDAYRSIVQNLGRERYSLADIQRAAAETLAAGSRDIALRIANLGVSEWDIWAEEDQAAVSDLVRDWRVLVLDVGGFEHPAEKSLVASALLNELWRQRTERQPTLIVVDEAHNIYPQEPDHAIQARATERAIAIAGEGRKFGLYLLLATQRPQKIHVNVLSQCDNLVLMRMNSTEDVGHLAETFSFISPSLLARSTTFSQGQALIAGKIAPTPLLAQFGRRLSQEGGSDVPDTWAGRT